MKYLFPPNLFTKGGGEEESIFHWYKCHASNCWNTFLKYLTNKKQMRRVDYSQDREIWSKFRHALFALLEKVQHLSKP